MHDEPAGTAVLDRIEAPPARAVEPAPRRRRLSLHWALMLGRGVASGADWLFGLATLLIGLATLAALPIVQFLSLGYLLESSARVARTGRLRDGLIGVRPAARIGGAAAGGCLALLPAWLVASFARSAALIDPGGPVARRWRAALVVATALTLAHLALAALRGGRLRHFLWPFRHPSWLARRLRAGGLYSEARDRSWAFVGGLRPGHYFRLGAVGFLGTLAWLAIPAGLLAAGGRAPLLGVLGAILLALVASWLPSLQVGYATQGKVSALYALRDVRSRFLRAPWAFAFALATLLLASIPLYLLKIEIIPREAAWLPSLVFIGFLAPARLLVGWAYARAARRERPRHWLGRWIGRLAIVPVAALYVLVVFFAQYTSWGGTRSLFEQHAFLLPVPFLGR